MTSFLYSDLELVNKVGTLDRRPYLSMRFTHATTSWLDGLEGLSRFITPELMYDLRSRLRGVQPLGIGVK